MNPTFQHCIAIRAAIRIRITARLSWCIIGGESGHNARVCHIEHLRSLTKACQKSQVPIFVKQLGAKPMLNNAPYKISDKKGGILTEFPADLQLRQFP